MHYPRCTCDIEKENGGKFRKYAAAMTLRRGLFTIGALIVIYRLRINYAWHLIFLNEHIIKKPSRSSCPTHRTVSPFSADGHPPRIGILLVFDEAFGKTKMAQLSVENKRKYAHLHGYELIISTKIDASRPAAWSKLIEMKKYLLRFDYLVSSVYLKLLSN